MTRYTPTHNLVEPGKAVFRRFIRPHSVLRIPKSEYKDESYKTANNSDPTKKLWMFVGAMIN